MVLEASTNPDGDNIFYLFDWGDDTNSGWIGPYKSGEIELIETTSNYLLESVKGWEYKIIIYE